MTNEVELDGIVSRSAVISQYVIAPFSRAVTEAIPSPKNEREAPGFRHGEESGSEGKSPNIFVFNQFLDTER
ncbi:MAG: hypothetical protein WBA89_24790 [Microcoleus sp.]|uniref:hypothetical protein n=1 Tax=Microcoleus sp. TaxID=44472 RepID=UPI003C7445C3